MLKQNWVRFSIALVCIAVSPASASSPWDTYRKGQSVALMRHALAPGNGDPAQFTLGDCSTQRNLSGEGRAQAMRIGAVLKAQGVKEANVYTSQWCRCVDTATRLSLGMPEELPLLNSFYQDRSTEQLQTGELKNWIKERLENAESAPNLPSVLVTHQVNITALTGVFPQSGEIVFVGLNDGDPVVLGKYLMK